MVVYVSNLLRLGIGGVRDYFLQYDLKQKEIMAG
jgi:hypothetical protein